MHRRLFLSILLMGVALAPLHGQPADRGFLGRSAATWMTDLRKEDATTRRTAAFALGKCGQEGAPYVPSLIGALADQDEGVREAAAFAIGEIGMPAGLQAQDALLRMLQQDPAPAARRAAVYALGRLGERAAPAGEAVRRALGDKDVRVRQNAAWALGNLGEAVLRTAARDLSKTLQDPDPLVRRDTAMALSHGGPAAAEAVPGLVGALRDQNAAVRQTAAMALGNIGSAAEPAVPELIRLVRENGNDRDLWREALFALPKIGGPQVSQAIPAMRQALKDGDPLVREVVALTFVKIAKEPAAVDAVVDLARALNDAEVRVRRNAALALSIITQSGQNAPEAALRPMLDAVQRDPDVEVRLFISRAFWGFDLTLPRLDATRRALIQVALRDREKVVRYQLASLLAANLGPDAREVTPTLLEFLRDRQIFKVDETKASSTARGGEPRAGTGTTKVEETGEGDARHLAALGLGRIGRVAGPEARRALEEAARDSSSPKLQEEARKALGSFN